MGNKIKIYHNYRWVKWIWLFIVFVISFILIFFIINKNNPITKLVGLDYEEHTKNKENLEWNLILVNAWNEIPDNYELDLMTLSHGQMVDKRIYPDLQQMFDDARESGIYPSISSSYRNSSEQKQIMEDKIQAFIDEGISRRKAEDLAKDWVAAAGTSEHELGLALDINADKNRSNNEAVYAWLEKNSYKYGFVVRYPTDKSKITGVSHEPWHFRYVGKKAAKEMYDKDLCLEEYIEKLS